MCPVMNVMCKKVLQKYDKKVKTIKAFETLASGNLFLKKSFR